MTVSHFPACGSDRSSNAHPISWVQARDYTCQRNDPSISLEDIMRLSTWQVNSNKNKTKKRPRKQSPHPAECTRQRISRPVIQPWAPDWARSTNYPPQCNTACTSWPPECSAGERYNNKCQRLLTPLVTDWSGGIWWTLSRRWKALARSMFLWLTGGHEGSSFSSDSMAAYSYLSSLQQLAIQALHFSRMEVLSTINIWETGSDRVSVGQVLHFSCSK